MIQTIAIAEAVAATAFCVIAISRWVQWRQIARGWEICANDLEQEAESLTANVVKLSAALDASRNQKPGPGRRAKAKEQFAALCAVRVAELRGEVIA